MPNEPKEPPKPKQSPNRDNAKDANKRIRNSNRGVDATADFTNASPQLLHNAVCTVTGRGCAIQFGYTKDGSAMVIRIVGDGEPYNEYVRPTEDLDTYLRGLALDFEK